MKERNFRNGLFIWALLPITCLCIWLGIEAVLPREVIARAVSETGWLEWIQFFILSIGIIAAVIKLRKLDRKKYKLLAAWVFLGFLGCVYVAGEEISWGQWVFYWNTPELWMHYNDQNETNLHNMSSWFDQKPRILMEVAIIMSGFILPLVKKYKPGILPNWLVIILPPPRAAFLAAVYVFVKLSDVVGNLTDYQLFVRVSEIIEAVIYYYVVLYIATLNLNGMTRNPTLPQA